MKLKLPARFNNRQTAIVAAIIGGALLTSVSIFATGPRAVPAAIAEKAWPVSVMQAQPQRLRPNFSAYGKLESTRVAHLRSDLVARVKHVRVREGDWVQAGDLLLELDAREAELALLEKDAELAQAQANLQSATAQLKLEQQSAEHFTARYQLAQDKLKRHQNLVAERLISRALLDDVASQANQASIEYHDHLRTLSDLPNQIVALQATVAKARALQARAQLNLEKTAIRAPFAGPVTTVYAAPGDYTNLSTPLVEMADVSAAEVRVQIPDAYIAEFHRAQAAGEEIYATDGEITLQLARLAGHVRAGQTATDAFFALAEENVQAHALGRMLNLSITLPPRDDLIAVPVQSIYDSNKVFRVQDGRLQAMRVERVGEYQSASDGYRLLVRDAALNPGDLIITTQLPRAIDGLLVEIANAQEVSLAPNATL